MTGERTAESTASSTADRLIERWPAARPFAIAGSTAVVLGGLVAAVSRPLDLEAGSWAAAYLVLVGGVAQIALGGGHAWLAARAPSRRFVNVAGAVWNGAVVATVSGTVGQVPWLTTVAGGGLAVAVGALLSGARPGTRTPGWICAGYRAVGAVVLAGIPVGIALSWIRHA